MRSYGLIDSLGVVQFLPRSSDLASDARDGSGLDGPRLDGKGTSDRSMKQGVFWLACGLILVSVACSKPDGDRVVILGTTTSIGNSGLLEVLLPVFEQVSGARVRGHLVGSGLALRMLERGQADVVISHAPEMETKFLTAHPQWSYRKLMYNDFLLVGPLDDPATVLSAPSIEAAIQRIVERRARFVSRGDESGTHTRERQLLTLAGVALPAEQVVVTGQGMSRTLRIASEIEAYTLTDAATFARVGDALRLRRLPRRTAPLEHVCGHQERIRSA